MQIQTHAWEQSLLLRATEAIADASVAETGFDSSTLARAHAHCEAMTAVHSKSFHMASALLPLDKRRAARALYAFCRTTDDIVDEPGGDHAGRLAAWRTRALMADPPQGDLVAIAWTHARLQFGIPMRYAEQLIEGVARDLSTRRYRTFDELASYSYGVASTVGLMSMHIIGFSSQAAIPYAIKLGVALQLTNILRDVAEDWQKSRLYLPEEELEAFGLSEADVADKRLTPQWREFMRFQVERNRRLYDEAMPGIGLLHSDGRFAIAAAADLYRAILTEIERRQYDVFSGRATVSRWGKLGRLPRIWWRSRTVHR